MVIELGCGTKSKNKQNYNTEITRIYGTSAGVFLTHRMA
jgi:hypothetical protein